MHKTISKICAITVIVLIAAFIGIWYYGELQTKGHSSNNNDISVQHEVLQDCTRLTGKILIEDDIITCVTNRTTFKFYDIKIGEWSTEQ